MRAHESVERLSDVTVEIPTEDRKICDSNRQTGSSVGADTGRNSGSGR
jgi:hypothetical protein